jgi:hypothetical protein
MLFFASMEKERMSSGIWTKQVAKRENGTLAGAFGEFEAPTLPKVRASLG